MADTMSNTPTPSLIYPKSSGLYLMSRIQELTANVADLIETLVQRDRQIAAMEGMLNHPETLKKRLEDLAATGTPSLMTEHADIRKARATEWLREDFCFDAEPRAMAAAASYAEWAA